jgi:hypothetical protein
VVEGLTGVKCFVSSLMRVDCKHGFSVAFDAKPNLFSVHECGVHHLLW